MFASLGSRVWQMRNWMLFLTGMATVLICGESKNWYFPFAAFVVLFLISLRSIRRAEWISWEKEFDETAAYALAGILIAGVPSMVLVFRGNKAAFELMAMVLKVIATIAVVVYFSSVLICWRRITRKRTPGEMKGVDIDDLIRQLPPDD